jgi:hypothetical protein
VMVRFWGGGAEEESPGNPSAGGGEIEGSEGAVGVEEEAETAA